MRVVLWGAGQTAELYWREIKENSGVFKDDYVAFTDNNSDLWNKDFHGIKIIAPQDIQKADADCIVILSIYVNDIRNQLSKELNITEDMINTFDEYKRKCHCEWVYSKKYGALKDKNVNSVFNLDNLAVYTAIMGNYDELKEPLFVSDEIKYICYTNNPKLKSNIWEIRYVENTYKNNTYMARHIKINPHKFLSEFDTSVWIDGNFLILDDIRKYIKKYQYKSKILCFPHYTRECICDEVAACINLKKGNKKDMLFQVVDYLKEGYPINNGLFETGCMIRAHNDAEVKELMEDWEKEILKYSIRDQLSFPFICWKNQFEPDICDVNIYQNNWLKYYKHNF